MNVVGHAPPPFFKRGPAPMAQLVLFLALSIVMLVADLRFHTLEWLRLGIGTAAWPLQRLAYLPVEASGGLGKYLATLSSVQSENSELHRKQLTASSQLLRQRYLEDENEHLRALLDMKEAQPVSGQVADILYAARDPFARRVIINRGSQQDVAPGQVVIDDIGVVGQVTRVFPLLAEVTLISDKNQAVPVEVQRNGLRAVLAGTGAGLELRFLASNAEVQVGDVLVTSGLDGVYLPGLPVAKVAQIDRTSAYMFAHITCTPLAGVEQHGQVLVMGERKNMPARPDDPAATSEPSGKGRRVKKPH